MPGYIRTQRHDGGNQQRYHGHEIRTQNGQHPTNNLVKKTAKVRRYFIEFFDRHGHRQQHDNRSDEQPSAQHADNIDAAVSIPVEVGIVVVIALSKYNVGWLSTSMIS